MYQKKQYIFSEELGVCRVDDITKLVMKQGEAISYYVLRSCFQNDKVAYIPVENHEVLLRELITKEEAQKKVEDWKNDQMHKDCLEKYYREEEEIGSTSWQLKMQMAETLPKEEREQIYLKGEVDFVLNQDETKLK